MIKISPVLAFLVLFVALKLCGVLSWSWLWVLSPLWIPALVLVASVILILLVTVILALVVAVAGAFTDAWQDRRRRK